MTSTEAEDNACEMTHDARFVAIADRPAGDGAPVIYLSQDGPADYRIFVQSRRFSAREAAALIVGATRSAHHGSPTPRSEAALTFH